MKKFSNSKLHKQLNKKISARVWISVIILIGVISGLEILMYHQWVDRQFEALSGTVEIFKVQKDERGLSFKALENAKYYIQSYGEIIELRNGEYFEEWNSDSASGLRVGIQEDKAAFGDLNKDNKDDAAIIVYSSRGGIPEFRDLAIIINDNEEPFFLCSTLLGDRVEINSIRIELGIIVLNMVVHGPNDALCCPTVSKIVKYKLSGNKLVETTE